MKTLSAIVVFSAVVANSATVLAEQPQANLPAIVVAAADQPVVDGEVRKVDSAAKKITIKHGEIKSLDMPPMTMVFQVKDPAMLDQVKAGDKVKFRAEKINGAFTVVEIEAAK
jgi:Cu(I)/Ag(I) efflux system protein CusF